MFKKIVITTIVLLPLLLILIGYPLSRTNVVDMSQLKISQRCFVTGDTRQYLSCLPNRKLEGVDLLIKIISNMNGEILPMGYFFIISIILQIPLVYLCVKELEKKD